ncbi:BTAD domain-containing putative transcriptional regulator [Streptomyces zhihengii]
MRLELLGSVRAWCDGTEVLLGPPKQRAVIGVLVSRINEIVGVEEIVDAVWGSAVPQTAANGVHTYVAGLRRVLDPGRGRRESGGVLVSSGGGYALCLDPGHVDTALFERHHAQARRLHGQGRLPEALREFDTALGLWRGDAYANVPGPFAEMERTRLGELRMTAVEEWAADMLAVGRHAEVVPVLSNLVAKEPLRERLRWFLMLTLYRCGRRAHALGVYRETRRLLSEELGLEPGIELQTLHSHILEGHPDLLGRVTDVAALRESCRPHGRTPAQQPLTESLVRPAQLPYSARGSSDARRNSPNSTSSPRRAADGPRCAPPWWCSKGPRGRQVHPRPARGPPAGRPFPGRTALRRPGGQRSAPPRAERTRRPRPGPAQPRRAQLPPPRRPRRTHRALPQPDARQADARGARRRRQRGAGAPLVPSGPSCVLVTSRRAQRGLVVRDGAYRIGLKPLDLGESVRLLTYLIGEGRMEGQREAAARLAEMCGRLPLALRIAAEGLADHPRLSFADMVQQHAAEEGRLDRLAVEDDVAASLRAAYDVVYDALPADAARLFRLLGLHQGELITAAAGAALTETDPSTAAQLLQVLADHHMIEEAGGGVFRFHTLLRIYAAECAEREPSRHRTVALARLLAEEEFASAI